MSTEQIDVIVPVYRGKAWIAEFFESIAQQTLSRDRFHLIFVFNGPEDGAYRELLDLGQTEPDLRFTLVREPRVGASRARQAGIELARSEYITFIDIDDLISQTYLERLLEHASPSVMAMALMVDMTEARDQFTYSTPIAKEFLNVAQRRIQPAQYRRAFSFMTGKLFPRSWALEAGLPMALQSGEDVAFYGRILAQNLFILDVSPGLGGATYFRRRVSTSVSRGRADFDFMIKERAMVIEDLSISLQKAIDPSQASVIEAGMSAQAGFIRRYLESNPDDYQRAADYLVSCAIDSFPWPAIVPAAEDLVVAYNFVPYADTGAIVASKRIREFGRPVDVISNNMSHRREKMPENMLLASPYISRHRELETPTSFNHPRALVEFVRHGVAVFEKLRASAKRPYRRLFSRSMWPGSHLLAAQIKKKYPALEWTAEFSDPVKLTVTGEFRAVELEGTELASLLLDGLDESARDLLRRDLNLYSWTELLPYMFAESMIFTNRHQLEIMVGYSPLELHDRIRQRAIVSPHPTLPRAFYELQAPEGDRSRGLKLGYFGEFYSTRNVHEVISALGELEDDVLADLEFHVFSTDSPKSALDACGVRQSVKERVHHNPKVSYLNFVSLLDQFDVLIVNDASTRDHHSVNPYLPSKYSDYLGSNARIWSLFEPGSVLSSLPKDYGSSIGDISAAVDVIRRIIADHPDKVTKSPSL